MTSILVKVARTQQTPVGIGPTASGKELLNAALKAAKGSSINGVVSNVTGGVRGNRAAEDAFINASRRTGSLSGVVGSVAGGVRGNTALEDAWVNASKR